MVILCIRDKGKTYKTFRGMICQRLATSLTYPIACLVHAQCLFPHTTTAVLMSLHCSTSGTYCLLPHLSAGQFFDVFYMFRLELILFLPPVSLKSSTSPFSHQVMTIHKFSPVHVRPHPHNQVCSLQYSPDISLF